MSVLSLEGRLQRRWLLALLSVCALFSVAAAAGWTATVEQVSNINLRTGAYPYQPTAIGDDLYFYADAGPDDQLFRTRGGETVQLTHIYTDSIGIAGDYTPYLPPARAGSSIFLASMQMWTENGVRPYEIWRVNESLPGGAELYWRSDGAIPVVWANAGDLLYVRMRNGSSDELWMTDGGDGGLQLVKAGLEPVYGGGLEQTGATAAYFNASASLSSPVWYWRADAAGVTPLDTLGVSSNEGDSSAVLQDDFYVRNWVRVVRVPAGSAKGELIFDGGWDYQLQGMYALGGKLFLVDAANPYTGPEFVLWRYDPAQSRLQRIGAYGSPIAGLTAMGDSVYFVLNGKDGAPARLMRLSHTSSTAVEAGTLSGDLVDGNSPSTAATDSMLYMQLVVNRGWELWGSDGTAAGTRSITRLWDYDQDSKFNNCPCITPAGGALYFDKMASAKSVEMWRVNVTETPADPHHLYLPQVNKQP